MMKGMGGDEGGDKAKGKKRPSSKAAEGGDESGTSSSADLDPGDGSMENCPSPLPAQVEKDRQEMVAFRKSCAITANSKTQRMALNDYSTLTGAPKMYLFDADGQCYKRMSVSYGNGGGRTAGTQGPKACADNGDKLTPPGFHLTVTHNGTYKSTESLGLAGLEGQQSVARGVIIHKSNNPGIASSWGCSGVGNIDAVMKYLGTGALV